MKLSKPMEGIACGLVLSILLYILCFLATGKSTPSSWEPVLSGIWAVGTLIAFITGYFTSDDILGK